MAIAANSIGTISFFIKYYFLFSVAKLCCGKGISLQTTETASPPAPVMRQFPVLPLFPNN
jgi:hypothetical protein